MPSSPKTQTPETLQKNASDIIMTMREQATAFPGFVALNLGWSILIGVSSFRKYNSGRRTYWFY